MLKYCLNVWHSSKARCAAFSLGECEEVTIVSNDSGGGGTPLHGLYRYVRPQRVGFFSRFGYK